MIRIINVMEYEGGITEAADYIHDKWGSERNRNYYFDAISHSSRDGKSLPGFFLLMKEGKMIGCAGLIANDFVSRHDLWPWVCSLYVEEKERGHAYGSLLLEHALKAAGKAGFGKAYLTTDHDGYYEKYGWKRIEDCFDIYDGSGRVYVKET